MQTTEAGYFKVTFRSGGYKLVWANDLGKTWRNHTSAQEIEPVEVILKKPKYLEGVKEPEWNELDNH